jgi:hypothetical protein
VYLSVYNQLKCLHRECICIVNNFFPSSVHTINIDKNSIHNLTTNYQLTDNQQLTLALGLNFVPIPRANHNSYLELVRTQFNDFARRVRIRTYFSTNINNNDISQLPKLFNIEHKQNVWQPPISYMNIEQYLSRAEQNIIVSINKSQPNFQYNKNPLWMQHSISELIQMTKNDLIIKPADKNMGVTIQNRLTYERDCLAQLTDTDTYTQITYNSIKFDVIFDAMCAVLDKYSKLFNVYNSVKSTKHTNLAKYILQMNNAKFYSLLRLARFYIIYKVHKFPVAARPICSNLDTVTYYASKFIDKTLQPFIKLATSFVKSAQSMVLLLDKFRVHDSYKDTMVIVCADVTSLYPSIPIILGVEFMHKRLTHLNNSHFAAQKSYLFKNISEIDFLCDLTLFILQNNYIEFGNLHFQQIRGTAMGTPLAVVFANLFLQQLEHIVFSKLIDEFPVLFKRFIDDILAFFKRIEHAHRFIEIYNSIVESINVTHTISRIEGIFLDLVVFIGPRYISDNKLDVKLYQKPQNKYLYLPQFSFHNGPIFKAFINAELNRIMFNCTCESDYITNKELFRSRLLKRTYNSDFLNSIFNLPRNRQLLFDKIVSRQLKYNNIISKRPIIFKTIFDQESTQINLKQCLILPKDITSDPTAHKIFNFENPIICYKKSPSLGQKFSRTKYDHTVSILNVPPTD